MATAEQTLLTAEEFGLRPDVGRPEELVRGRIVMSPPPNRGHGYTCAELVFHLRRFLEDRKLGRVYSNDSAIIVERNPDTVRGADVAYYSFARLPEGSRSTGYGPEVPELVFEVKSPSDRWPDIARKVAEYLNAGVLFVTVVDPDDGVAVVYGSEWPPRTLGREDELAYPDILPGFSVVVGRLFE